MRSPWVNAFPPIKVKYAVLIGRILSKDKDIMTSHTMSRPL
jgi:hypothetical protein